MLKFMIEPNVEAEIRFQYSKPQAVTFCLIFIRTPKWVRTFSGVSLCTDKQFIKEKGRKLALARALKDANAPKEVRRLFWSMYHSRGIFPSEEVQYILNMVPEAEFLPWKDTVELAKKRDEEAALVLKYLYEED